MNKEVIIDIENPQNDIVSRKAVCNIVNDIRDCISVEGYCAILERMKKLPSITPSCDKCAMNGSGSKYCDNCEQKSGKWIRVTDKTGHLVWECDKCGWQQRLSNNFCPDCGAKMVEPQESEE